MLKHARIGNSLGIAVVHEIVYLYADMAKFPAVFFEESLTQSLVLS